MTKFQIDLLALLDRLVVALETPDTQEVLPCPHPADRLVTDTQSVMGQVAHVCQDCGETVSSAEYVRRKTQAA